MERADQESLNFGAEQLTYEEPVSTSARFSPKNKKTKKNKLKVSPKIEERLKLKKADQKKESKLETSNDSVAVDLPAKGRGRTLRAKENNLGKRVSPS